MTKFILGALLLLGNSSISFGLVNLVWNHLLDMKMTPWFGYEPGYGPGWGRKGCCNGATAESISANNQG